MTAEYRRGLALAGLGLVGGIALVVAMFGTGELLKRHIPQGGSQGGPAAPPPADGHAPAQDGAGAPLAVLPEDSGKGSGKGSGESGKPAGASDPHAAPAGRPQGQSGARPGEPGSGEPGPDEPERTAPVLDIVRVEPDGETVVAGRAEPNATIEFLRDGKPVTSAVADGTGQFAIIPPPLPPGSHEITLRARDKAGAEIPGRQSVAVVVAPERNTKPLIALSDPDKPTQVLSRPDAQEGRPEAGRAAEGEHKSEPKREARAEGKPEPKQARDGASGAGSERKGASGDASKGKVETGRDGKAEAPPSRTAALPPAGPSGPVTEPKRPAGAGAQPGPARGQGVKIVAIDAQEGGRLDVSGQAAPDAALRLYLNDTLVASGRADGQGRIAFTIGRGVRPGSYQVRVDQVDAATGKVAHRAEVAFAFPEEAAPRVAERVGPAVPPARPSPQGPGRAVAEVPAAGERAQGRILPRTPDKAPEATPGKPSAAPPSEAPARRAEAPAQAGRETSPGPGAGSGKDLGKDLGARWTDARRAAGPPRPAPAGTDETRREAAGPVSAVPEASDGTAAPRPGAVFVAEISTARIVRGDSLWQISRRTYGRGNRYTVIYDANQEQIRDPNRIYPGQMFVLPQDVAPGAADRPANRG